MRGLLVLVYLALILVFVPDQSSSVFLRANVNTKTQHLGPVPLEIKYMEQVPASESEVKALASPAPKLPDIPVLSLEFPSGTIASVYSGSECGKISCEPLRGQRLKDVVKGVGEACEGFEEATCTCALEEMGVTCICENVYRDSGKPRTLMDLLDKRARAASENMKKLAAYEAGIVAGLPKDDEDVFVVQQTLSSL